MRIALATFAVLAGLGVAAGNALGPAARFDGLVGLVAAAGRLVGLSG